MLPHKWYHKWQRVTNHTFWNKCFLLQCVKISVTVSATIRANLFSSVAVEGRSVSVWMYGHITSHYVLTLTNPTVLFTRNADKPNQRISAGHTGQLMLYREIIAVCSEIHTKHTNTLCGQNGEFLNAKLSVLNYILRPSPYRAVNTLRLSYTNQSVNAV
jgi:hypothetical protein